ncbi:MAG: fluoride efflux transporter CrcB [Verrucomicrobia bacterium]|nr:MAG: fluoride efflux transporter CrcB [Verrucomicrobiota bacterium]
MNYLWVFFGGGLGSILRYILSGVIVRHVGETFPWGTLLVNVSGSFIIGFFATYTGPDGRWFVGPSFRTFFMIGICGGYTTFSAFSLQTLAQLQDGEWFRAGANILLSVMLCLLGVWLGHLLAANLGAMKGS